MTALPDYAEALGQALRGIEPLGQTTHVELSAAGGRVLGEPIIADRDLPPFDRAQMDGYALRAEEVGRVEAFAVQATIHAGQPADVSVPSGHCVAIATGAPLPDDVDTVIPHEQSDRGDPVRFTIDSIQRGQAVHARGADARRGDTLIAPGTVLRAQHLGIAAAIGQTHLVVACSPATTVLTSGDEVRPAGEPVANHQIRNTNAPMVCELLRRIGAEPIKHQHVADNAEATAEAVAAALEQSDLVITVGGISAGERDYFPQEFRAHEVVISLHSAAIQPGRPILVGRHRHGVVVVGLPGNPVSVLACMCLFCWPIVRVMLGLDATLPWRDVELAEEVKPNPRRRAFRPAVLVDDTRARVPEWAGSGDLAHTATTDGLLEFPVQAEPVQAGARLRFLPWP
ncbi:MAG: molybdopterin molybdotransferase MoeA [Planctomycetes bacterium]|nr:molybdopterin molybdotransferase MoeA [Planctomycetota bacterium]